MFAYAAGIVGAMLLFLGLLAVELIPVPENAVWKQNIRRIADGTFVIYLFHYPVMLLLSLCGILPRRATTSETLQSSPQWSVR